MSEQLTDPEPGLAADNALRTASAAKLFPLIAEVTRLLHLAYQNNQEWFSHIERGTNANGEPTDGFEIRIRIEPTKK